MNTRVITYATDYITRCLDDVIMISTTTADHGLYIPALSTTPIIATRCRGDVLVDVATDVVFLPVPPGDVVVVAVLICSVCAPVQLRADEYLLHR